ncbi:RNA-guided endonuclease InsQ/TnpB family protein [Micromonospora sp. SL4-19]|uniref:RNA-guided endonuclease InsQ/TnpB family protein n=1 Tax=Micromonospora sp. SL4-19 TaxID=3399129 RepID=UPI003A4D5F72
MLTGRRYLLGFTDEQADYARQVGAACRAVWNTALEQRREYRRRGAFIGYNEQARQMAEAKKDPDCAWLADAPSHTLQQTLRDLDRACKTHGTWKVRWRSKSRTAPSFRFPDPDQIGVRRLNRRWGEVRLPRFGQVRFRWTRPLDGTIRNATVSRDGGRWYISFCVEDGVTEAAPNGKPPVGVDRGVAVAIATSDGDLRDREFVTPGEAARLKRLQQRLSRSLRQTCNACKHVAPESRKSQAVFWCVACGHQDHADVNAAKNILAAGLAVTGRGDLADGRSAKRQPPG